MSVRSRSARRRSVAAAALAGLMLLTGCSSAPPASLPQVVPSRAPATATPVPTPTRTPAPPGFLLPGEAAALPALPAGVPFTGHLLIAESSSHSRLTEIDPSGNITWTFPTTSPPLLHPLGAPDDAFYSTDGSSILLSSEDGQGAMAIDRTSGAVLWQIGTYDRRGKDSTHFNNPDDLAPAADGSAWMADINNCRILHLSGSTGATISILGGNGCRHNPPQQFATPNGAFPTRDGSVVVTEIGSRSVNWINPDGTLRWSHRVPAGYPSDGMAYPDGSVLLTDYSTLGQVLRIGADGAVLWKYAPRGKEQLNHTSIAIPLASNRVAICDDFNNRIVVVDPTTSTVVWQWSGSGSYHLARPDGIDYRPF
ncbi:MAG: PQQ-binding-like beta-propeller repeat protein [Candidatus Dormibacteraeota bacterium]|uniref:PQQ-binding-like beta-propeller repeat protein n=1 Tax=Candidatus Amunia macphersoniae TaxID=3127014 RepID=A0A934NII6_9BACT|nr:PQQ-binding-like beta-propeller repeat protein [Candidatus Dormibacteraeota bacterium]